MDIRLVRGAVKMENTERIITLDFGKMSISEIHRAPRIYAEICDKEVQQRQIGWKPNSIQEIQQWNEGQTGPSIKP